MTAIPPPPSEPPGGFPIPPPPGSPWAVPQASPPTQAPPPTQAGYPAQPQWGPYAQPGPKKRGFVWWEGVLGALAGVVGNVLVALLPLGSAAGSVFVVYNLGWLVVPLLLKRWSYTIGFVVGVVGAIALAIVVLIFTCASTLGGSNG